MRAILLSLVVVLPSWAAAQELPNPKPTPAHKLLAQDVGSWDCDLKMFFQGPDGPATEFKGLEVNVLVSGDLYLRTEFTCQMGDRKIEGHSLMGYDAEKKKYTGLWADNLSGAPAMFEGEYDAEGKTYTQRSRIVDESGQVVNQKMVTTRIDESTKKTEVFWVVSEGVEVKIMEMTAKKRG